MKQFFLSLALGVAITASALAGPPNRIEIGKFTSGDGQHILAAYVFVNNQCTEVDLFWPNGQRDVVHVMSGTTVETLDLSLQRLVNYHE